MNTGSLILIYLLIIAIVMISLLARVSEKYKRAFRETATKLYSVTADRDALFIENAGLRSRLGKVSTLKQERSALVVRHYFSGDGNQCGECGHFLDHDIHA